MNFQQEVDTIMNKVIRAYNKGNTLKLGKIEELEAVGNIYFLFSNDKLVYIGQRKEKYILSRLKNHFFGKGFSIDKNGKQNGTISKWDKVKKEIDNGNTISFKTLLVKPDSLRNTVEQELIKLLKPSWNVHK